MPHAHINGIDLYYEVHGGGPPVLMSHGAGSNHLHWWQQVGPFAKDFTVITFDHRGFGFSTDDGQGPAMIPDDIIALLDFLEIEKAAFVGQSLGGVGAGLAAARHPERVTAMALTSTTAGWVDARPRKEYVARELPKTKNYLEAAHVLIHSDGFPQRSPDLCFLFEQMAQLNHTVDFKRLRELMAGERGDMQRIIDAGIPVSLAVGEEDEPHVGALTEISEKIPGTDLKIIPDCGHLFFFERAEIYNELTLDFLSKHLLGK